MNFSFKIMNFKLNLLQHFFNFAYHILNIIIIIIFMKMSNRVKVTNRGMITIPSKIRKKFNIVDGKEYFIVEDFDGALMLIPFIDIEKEENRIENSIVDNILNIMENERQQEIDVEFRE